MADTPDPEVVALQSEIFASGLKLADVRKEAKLGRATWHRWTRGELPRLSSLRRMQEAVSVLKSKRENA